MYLITYQKSNGDVFCRIRNTIPQYKIGGETSMGWKVLDIKYRFKDTYYTLPECRKQEKKYYKKLHIINHIKHFLKSNYTMLFVVILVILIK